MKRPFYANVDLLAVTCDIRRERQIFAAARRKAKGMSEWLDASAASRELFYNCLVAAFRMADQFRAIGFCEGIVSTDQLSEMVQDGLLALDDLEVAYSIWNAFDAIRDGIWFDLRPRDRRRRGRNGNPCRRFVGEIESLTQMHGAAAGLALVRGWASLSEWICLCMEATADAASRRAKLVAFSFSPRVPKEYAILTGPIKPRPSKLRPPI